MADNEKWTLMPGRWQPFHDGHKALIQKVLDEGRNVCIAIRDTPNDDRNPFTLDERFDMIREWGANKRISIIAIPDIDEVACGRGVGWGFRVIELDEETEAISGTEIRARDKA